MGKERVVTPEGVKVPVAKVEITFVPGQGLNVNVPDDPILAFGLIELAKEAVRAKLKTAQSPIVRV